MNNLFMVLAGIYLFVGFLVALFIGGMAQKLIDDAGKKSSLYRRIGWTVFLMVAWLPFFAWHIGKSASDTIVPEGIDKILGDMACDDSERDR